MAMGSSGPLRFDPHAVKITPSNQGLSNIKAWGWKRKIDIINYNNQRLAQVRVYSKAWGKLLALPFSGRAIRIEDGKDQHGKEIFYYVSKEDLLKQAPTRERLKAFLTSNSLVPIDLVLEKLGLGTKDEPKPESESPPQVRPALLRFGAVAKEHGLVKMAQLSSAKVGEMFANLKTNTTRRLTEKKVPEDCIKQIQSQIQYMERVIFGAIDEGERFNKKQLISQCQAIFKAILKGQFRDGDGGDVTMTSNLFPQVKEELRALQEQLTELMEKSA